MKNNLLITTIIGLGVLFAGCQQQTSGLLNTSKLEEEQQVGQTDNIPKVYHAPSLEVALDAVPFQVKVPTELPFESNGFEVFEIRDWFEREDKKDISLTLQAINKERTDNHFQLIEVNISDFEVNYGGVTPSDEITLKDGIKAVYNGGSNSGGITFSYNDLIVEIGYLNRDDSNKVSEERVLEILTNLANQMID
ncbi:hypothetical protein [Bacillus alkalisoli]|uniref:hypothetical protein n=1 Tax=Bacillus alkalisoli TaxID=2011008 RepID=UPI000C235AF7|nr:hypothetical protein [Bacillus alkalisoli]